MSRLKEREYNNADHLSFERARGEFLAHVCFLQLRETRCDTGRFNARAGETIDEAEMPTATTSRARGIARCSVSLVYSIYFASSVFMTFRVSLLCIRDDVSCARQKAQYHPRSMPYIGMARFNVSPRLFLFFFFFPFARVIDCSVCSIDGLSALHIDGTS